MLPINQSGFIPDRSFETRANTPESYMKRILEEKDPHRQDILIGNAGTLFTGMDLAIFEQLLLAERFKGFGETKNG